MINQTHSIEFVLCFIYPSLRVPQSSSKYTDIARNTTHPSIPLPSFCFLNVITSTVKPCQTDTINNKGREGRKEGNISFNDALNTFYLRLYGEIGTEETRCHHIGYSFRLTARVFYIHGQDSTYHDLCYTSRGALAGTRNSSMSPPHEGSIRWPIAPWVNALTTELYLAPKGEKGIIYLI